MPEQILFEYAAGWTDIAGGRQLNGAATMMMRAYPSAGIATVVMTNATGFDVGKHLDATDFDS